MDGIDSTVGDIESSATQFEEVIRVASIIDEVDLLIDDINSIIDDQTTGMIIPVDPDKHPQVSKSVGVISGGDHDSYIDQRDWMGASLPDSPESILNIAHKFDLMDVLWTEFRIRIAEWLANTLDNVPVIGDNIADKLRADAASSRDRSFGGIINQASTGRPLSPDDLMRIGGITHADTILGYIRAEISKPQQLNFNPAAVELKPIVDGVATTWRSTRSVVGSTYGMSIAIESVEPGTLTDRVKSEGMDIVQPLLSAYSHVRSKVITPDFWEYGVVRTRGFLMGVRNALHGYLTGKDLACCLLDNILGVSSVIGRGGLKYLQMLRLGLTYSFNGLCIQVDSLFDILADMFNHIVAAAMGKVMSTLTSVLDNWLISVRNYFVDFAARKGEAWRRCYPFDELMNHAMLTLGKMESDLIAYISDYVNTMKVTHVNLSKYVVQLKEREYVRKMLLLADLLTRGVETGIICKDLGDMSVEYSRPTDDELIRFSQDYTYRMGVNVHEARDRFMMAPESGARLVGDIELDGRDLTWLQNCDLSLTAGELGELRYALTRMGLA